MLFRDVQKKRLEILMKIDGELQDLEPLFYSEVSEGDFIQFTRAKKELQRLTRSILAESLQEVGDVTDVKSKMQEMEKLK
jgi:hypothetical protein